MIHFVHVIFERLERAKHIRLRIIPCHVVVVALSDRANQLAVLNEVSQRGILFNWGPR